MIQPDLPPEFEKALRRCKSLPTLPGVAVRIIALSEDPNVSMNAVSKLVSHDPALSARLLRIANSPLYAQRRSVENLNQALMLLGLNATLSLALSFSLVKSLRDGATGESLDYDRCWRRALIAASAARILAPRIREHSAEELFLAALLEDVGILALDQVLAGGDYGAFVNGIDEHEHLVDAERRKYGVDHVQVGCWLLGQWQLPEFLRRAVGASHATNIEDAASPVERGLALASRIADAMVGDAAGEALPRLQALAQALMQIDGEALHRILGELNERLPDLEALFDVKMPEPADRELVLEQAREMMMLHNLRAQQTVSEIREESARLQDHARSLEEKVRRDGLTGVYNREHMDAELKRQFELANESGSPLSVLFIDIDHFKNVNDTWGHAVGDQVLVGITRRFDEVLRKGHVLGRYGGEEFVLMLPGVGTDAGWALAERLRETLAETPAATVAGQDVFVSFSGGLATHGEGKYFDTWAELVRAADHVMYAAKIGGRNQVVVYGANERKAS